MPGTLDMTDKQHAPAGITLLDADGQPFTEKPANISVAFTSSDPSVADFVVGPDGMNGDVTSGRVGSAIITVTVTLGDGSVLTDALAVAVRNSLPGSANFTAGAPVDE